MLRRKVCVLGLDGLDFGVIGPLLEAGEMPVLAGLQRRGAWGRLRSVVPPISPAAWTTLCTGVNPGQHGIAGFGSILPGSYDTTIISTSDVKAPQLWDYAAAAGKRSVVFALPHLHPPVPIHGVMVTGAMTPHARARWCTPGEVEDELTRAGLGFRKRLSVNTAKRIGPARTAAAVTEHAAHQAATLRYLLKHQDWDLAVAVLDSPDLIQHILLGPAFLETRERDPHDMRAILATPAGQGLAAHFRDLDRLVGEILADLPTDAAVLVVSDHGFLPRPRVIQLPQWLAQHGYQRTRRLGLSADASVWRQRTLGAILSSLHLKFALRLLPQAAVSRVISVPRLGRLLNAGVPDWAATRAFADTTVFCLGVRVNLKGREPRGVVEPRDYEALRDELMRELLAIRDPATGEPVVVRAWRREELHPGEHNGGEPDVYVEYHAAYRAVPRRGAPMLRPAGGAQAAGHANDGVLLATGPGINPTGDLGQAQLMDAAPTILALLGVGIPPSMEGQAMGFVDPALIARGQEVEAGGPAEEPAYTDDEEEEVRGRLEDLGYL
jgi:predicted AlkP superfamily phosphohydrolase/phosphomutase